MLPLVNLGYQTKSSNKITQAQTLILVAADLRVFSGLERTHLQPSAVPTLYISEFFLHRRRSITITYQKPVGNIRINLSN